MNTNRGLHRQKGLTLIELMIAVTLSVILLTGVIVLFSANKATYRMQEGLSALQESGRYAISLIKRDVEIAGFGGCLTSEQRTQHPLLLVASPEAYVQEYRDGVRITGEDNASSLTVGSPGTAVADGTDVLQIRGPLGSQVFYVTGAVFPDNPIKLNGDASSAFSADDSLILGDCTGAAIFNASTVSVAGDPPQTTVTHTTGNKSTSLARKYGADSVVAPLFSHTYFIGNSTWPNSSGNVVLALFRVDGSGAAEEILQGVEDMQITYGVDANPVDGQADTFRDASAVSDWAEVVSVRVSLLINSIDDASQTAANYMYLPSGSTPVAPPDAADRLLRQEFSAVLTLRNNVF